MNNNDVMILRGKVEEDMSFTDFLNKELSNVDVIIYHGNCVDGTMAAACYYYFNVTIESHAVFIKGKHGAEEFTNMKNCHVYFLDFCYSLESLKTILKDNEVTIVDHHITNVKMLENFTHPNLITYLSKDNSKSGAKLAWEFFHIKEENTCPKTIPYIIDAVSQRDIWTWDQNDSVLTSHLALLDLVDKTPQVYTDIISNSVLSPEVECKKATTIGPALFKLESNIVDSLLKQTVVVSTNLSGKCYKVGVVNAIGHFSSDLGNKILLKDPTLDFSIVYQFQKDGLKLSFRSEDTRADVSVIAKSFGGGGHRNASGAFLKADTYEYPHMLRLLGVAS